MTRLAIFSPRQSARTETFIQAHREIPGVDVLFYFNGIQQAKLEGEGALLDLSMRSRVHKKLRNPLRKFDFSPAQEAVATSLLKEGVDCILAEYGMMGVQVLPIARALGIPLVVHFHGFDAAMYQVLEEMKDGYTELFAYASHVVVVSKKMAAQIAGLGCPAEKIALNTYGVHPDFLKVEAHYGEKILVGLGRFVDKKAPYYSILAFQQALAVHPDARLVLGGEGPLYDTCLNLVKHLGLEASISLPGLIQPSEFKKYLSEARAFVQHSIQPSSGDMEGTPLAVLEAQAAAVPVVSTYHAGIPDVVVHEETGLLCAEHDVALMAKHMIAVLSDQEMARRLGAAGRKRYVAHFTRERHLSELARIVELSIQ